MTMVAESRDVETGSHILRTKEYVVILARTLRENGIYKERIDEHFIDLLYRAAPLHDIGKVGIVDAILRKPGRLTREEFEIMKKHVTIGCSVIENAINSYNKTNEFLTVAANIARCHHERWDGGGYPTGLSGEEIPLEARLMALADVYDALISHRCYKEAIPFAEAETMIVAEEGKHFDPLIVWAFRLCREDLRRVACISCSGCSEREFEVPVEEYEQE
jgi:adenylate cyclase